ncbi:MAG: phospholipid/cholesterol/gamma-HCH transport system substrate-binding protein [Solirubrobacteraceae bacterium]|jgi:virulence factor Mce-like protein|nr:phospholipid/cholesterol/gamma-HCH transport system substrate-binding protein [Solirubrobacteraceae bacterium]
MGRRSPAASIAANPVLVGAVTTLVVIVAVFLAYNANNGLPFVPTRSLRVHIANGAELVPGNEVRSGGFRIGVVDEMKPVRLANGRIGAELHLKLDKKIGAVPADTTVTIRPRSALGLKYVEFSKGKSTRTLADGALLPERQTSVPVELDQFYNMFDKPTRKAAQTNLEGFGNAFAGRGEDLNRFIAAAPALFGHLQPVMANLADPQTNLKDFFKELGDAARIVAPVSKVNANLFTEMADTFEAWSRDPQALKDTIAKQPATLDVATHSLRVQRPFLEHTASFSRDLNAAAGTLQGALPPLNRALEVGTPVTRRSVDLNKELQGAMDALRSLSEAPTTIGALRGLTDTVSTLQPQLRYLGPYVTVCNNWNMFWTFTAEHFTAPDSTGGAERALLNSAATQDDGIGAQGANEFAHGKNVLPNNGGVPNYLHNNFYGDAVTPDGKANCTIGQQGYPWSSNPYDPSPDKTYKRVAVDHPYQDHPVGPSYRQFDGAGHGVGLNTDAVPPGETFTARPGGRGVDTPVPIKPAGAP